MVKYYFEVVLFKHFCLIKSPLAGKIFHTRTKLLPAFTPPFQALFSLPLTSLRINPGLRLAI